MATTTVLMYHAVCDDGAGADPHYTVTPAHFRRHLAMVGEAGARPTSVARTLAGAAAGADPAFTFDDGHASNAWAAQALADTGGSGDFFVNPSTVGRPGFLSWAALREMADAGMSIQSHGQNHRYMDELDEAGVMRELVESRHEIEDHLGCAAEIFAPPGGRMGPGFAALAERAGYTTICSSRVGVWKRDGNAADVPRFAVLHSTSDDQWRRWLRQDTREVLLASTRYHLLAAGKRALGNQRYERLRRGLLRTGA